jgi:hypothetical protein
MSADGEAQTLTFRVDDPDLLEAIDAAEEEWGSKSEALRVAVRASLVEREAGDGDDLPDVARKGLRKLRQLAGGSGVVQVDTAQSVLANDLKITKEMVKPEVFRPLRRAGHIGVKSRIHDSVIQVYPEVEA